VPPQIEETVMAMKRRDLFKVAAMALGTIRDGHTV
jgi:hypothetical protein